MYLIKHIINDDSTFYTLQILGSISPIKMYTIIKSCILKDRACLELRDVKNVLKVEQPELIIRETSPDFHTEFTEYNLDYIFTIYQGIEYKKSNNLDYIFTIYQDIEYNESIVRIQRKKISKPTDYVDTDVSGLFVEYPTTHVLKIDYNI